MRSRAPRHFNSLGSDEKDLHKQGGRVASAAAQLVSIR